MRTAVELLACALVTAKHDWACPAGVHSRDIGAMCVVKRRGRETQGQAQKRVNKLRADMLASPPACTCWRDEAVQLLKGA